MTTLGDLVGLLTAEGVERVYKFGAVPTSPPYPYAVLASSRMAADTRRLDGLGTEPVRFTVQIFGRTADVVAGIADEALSAFDGTFTNDDRQIRAEVTTPPYRDPDNNGVLNVTHTYRF